MSPDEFLEKVATESYKREVDQDESIWRSMPFVATAIALVVTVIGYTAAHLPPPEWAVLPFVLNAAVVLSGLSFVVAFIYIGLMVRERVYRYPPTDIEFAEYAEQLRAFHKTEGLEEEAELDKAVVTDLRRFYVEQFGAAASHNRQNNMARQSNRTRAFQWMLVGLALALFVSVVIFFSERTGRKEPPATGARSDVREAAAQEGHAADGQEAVTPGTALRVPRRALAVPKERPRVAGTAGAKAVSNDKPQSSAPKPATRPEPPKPQFLKKSESPPERR